METKGIDLTKCRNERARIRYRFVESSVYDATGYIEQVKDGWVHLVDDEDEGFIPLWHDGKIDENIMTFEIMPRDPETYKDWQVGDKVCEDEHRNACYEVIFRSGELVFFKDWNNWASNPMTCSEAFTRFGMRLVLTDIERQIIGEKKKYEPQAGDIVAWKEKEDECRSAISIYRKKNRAYFTLFVDGVTGGLLHNLAMNIVRPATEEEKQMLFDAMAKQGKRWNADKKVVEDITKPHEFRKGEPVLVRDSKYNKWRIAAYISRDTTSSVLADTGKSTVHWKQCIPYNERTMHLLGTTEDYKEE